MQKGLKVVLELENVMFFKNSVFVIPDYSYDGIFKLSINENNVSILYV